MNSDIRATPGSAGPAIAVLIPCFNEEPTIAEVVREFRRELPHASIYVYDNNSSDRTAEKAAAAGAIVRRERRQGKGCVMQSMFRDVEADVYVLVDGDGTYSADSVHSLIGPVLAGEADMVIGSRLHAQSSSDFRAINRLGNRFFIALMTAIFRVKLTDLLSGFRAFNRRFVKGVPLSGGGFEIETELTIKALHRGYRLAEVPINLKARPAGSFSKIRHVRDGVIIVNTIVALFRDYKPLTFFGAAGILLVIVGLLIGLVSGGWSRETEMMFGMPRGVLAGGLVGAGLLSGFAGVILHTVLRRFQEFEHHLAIVVHELNRPTENDAGRPGLDP